LGIQHWFGFRCIGFNLEKREEGEAQFELDRAEILTSTLHFMKGRFDPLFTPNFDIDA
jgi:hypothetical protein